MFAVQFVVRWTYLLVPNVDGRSTKMKIRDESGYLKFSVDLFQA